MAESSASLAYDEALIKQIGQFGGGQWLTVLWASFFCIANAAAFFFWTFATVDPVANHSWQCNSPADAACAAVWQQSPPSSQSFCSLGREQWQWTSQDSLVAKFDLTCSDAWKIQFANSLVFLGAFVGAGIFGYMCDRWGRRNPLFISTALIAAPMLASLAAPSYWPMAALRCVTGIGASGQAHCIFLLATEPVGPDFRGFAGTITLLFFCIGEFIMVALGRALPVWQHLLIACACINGAALLLYPLVHESARWLLSQGREEEAQKVLQRIAKANKSSMPTQPLVVSRSSAQLAAIETVEDSRSSGQGDSKARATVWRLLKQRQFAIRLFVLLLNWFGLMLNYYGIGLGAGGIAGSIYVTFAIGVVAEMIALLLVCPTVDRIGRHNLLAFGQLLGGGACIGCALVNDGTAQAILASIGKFGCSVGQPAMLIYTAELLPTFCRSTIMGMCSSASRLGSLVAPFLLMLGTQLGPVGGYSQVFVPFMVFGCIASLGGLLTLFMPETLGAAMPEQVEDLDALLSAITAKPWRRGFLHTLTFIVRTKAAYAYPTYTCRACRGHSCTCAVDPLFDPATLAAARGMGGNDAASDRGWDRPHDSSSMKDCEDSGWSRDDSSKGVESSGVTDRGGVEHAGVTVEAPTRSRYGDGSSSSSTAP